MTIGLAVAATVVSAAGSSGVSLWSDEVATVSASSRSVPELLQLVDHIDAVHATYYLLMHLWTGWFGTSPLSLRLPSALLVGLAVAGVHLLGRRLADPTTALLAAVVMAVLPRVTWAGIEARPSALSIALTVWMVLALHVAVTRRTVPAWTAYALTVAGAIGASLYAVLVVGALGLTVLAGRATRTALLPAGVATAGGLLLASPVVLTALGQAGQLGQRDLGPVRLAQNVLVNQWFLGDTPTPTTASGATFADALEPGGLWKVAGALLALLAWVLVARAVVRWRADRLQDTLITWTLPWLLLPTAVVVVLAVVSPSFYNARYVAFCAPALALLVAAGLRSVRPRAATALGVVGVLLLAPVYLSQRTTTAKNGTDWALVAEHLRTRTEPGDGVYFAPRDAATDDQALRSLRAVSIGYPEPFEGLQDVTLLASPAAGDTLFGSSTRLADSADRLEDVETLWVLRRQDRPEAAAADDALLADEGFAVVDVWDGPLTEVVELSRG
ncbi:MAG: hypothetical protein JWP95_352 [Actinotalea sp.]|nr:hypothetical protein [Actinotalea sp.]